MARKRARKVRVDFRTNRQQPGRPGDLTRRYAPDADEVEDVERRQSVRARGELSRKRTILVDEDNLPRVAESEWSPGTVTKVHGQFAYVREDSGVNRVCTVRRILRTLLIASRAPIAVGDRVWISDQSRLHDGAPVGVIERVAPRTSALARRDRRQRAHTIVANADQLLIVTSIAQPRLRPHLVDRYIVAALKGGLTPILCFNKLDLLHEGDFAELEDYAGLSAAGRDAAEQAAHGREELTGMDADAHAATVAEEMEQGGTDEVHAADEPDDDPWVPEEGEYGPEDDLNIEPAFRARQIPVLAVIEEFRRLGYACLLTSAATAAGLDELRAALKGHSTVLSGQSGVGKSTLLNVMQPGLQLATAPVSAETEKGRHTTTLAELLPLEVGGFVVDTPGIRSFDLWDVQPGELEGFFVEFVPHIQHCRFKNCLHRNEEDCAVRAAVERGEISLRRYLSYLKMFEEV